MNKKISQYIPQQKHKYAHIFCDVPNSSNIIHCLCDLSPLNFKTSAILGTVYLTGAVLMGLFYYAVMKTMSKSLSMLPCCGDCKMISNETKIILF